MNTEFAVVVVVTSVKKGPQPFVLHADRTLCLVVVFVVDHFIIFIAVVVADVIVIGLQSIWLRLSLLIMPTESSSLCFSRELS